MHPIRQTLQQNINIFACIKYVNQHKGRKLRMVQINELKIEQLEEAANMLKAIAHPMRIAIISLLEKSGRLSVTQIYEALHLEQSTASHHLGILKNKGVLSCKREGKNTYYFLRNENLGKILDCVGRCTV